MNRLFVRKSVETLLSEAGDTGHGLKRALGPLNLTTLGIGAVIGAGIFVLTGNAAAQFAGPAIVISFMIAGVGCAFAGLCYSEMVAMIPVAGSAYTYSYATMGELVAWIIGWDLILEYSVGTVAVSIGWSGFFVGVLSNLGINIPATLSQATGTHLINVPQVGWLPISDQVLQRLTAQHIDPATLPHVTALLNVPAILVVAAITVLLVIGVKESANVNTAIVIAKVAALLVFVGVGGFFLAAHPNILHENWREFIPKNRGSFGQFGWSGVLRGAGVIFFAYIGFDAISAEAQEARNPQRDMPIGILGSLAICTVIYILVGAVLTGLVHYDLLNVPQPVTAGMDVLQMPWLSFMVGLAAIGALSSAMLVMLMSQPRIFWAMAQDGLLPSAFAKIHPRFRTPYMTIIATGMAVAIFAGTTTIAAAGQLVSIGTLLAFTLVCIGVLVLRKTHPETPRPFRAPLGAVTPILGAGISLLQMAALPLVTWIRLVVWLVIGLAIYFAYGVRKSRIGSLAPRPAVSAGA